METPSWNRLWIVLALRFIVGLETIAKSKKEEHTTAFVTLFCSLCGQSLSRKSNQRDNLVNDSITGKRLRVSGLVSQ